MVAHGEEDHPEEEVRRSGSDCPQIKSAKTVENNLESLREEVTFSLRLFCPFFSKRQKGCLYQAIEIGISFYRNKHIDL